MSVSLAEEGLLVPDSGERAGSLRARLTLLLVGLGVGFMVGYWIATWLAAW